MALINHRAREIHFKIVYVGPGLGGKTTNLQMLHDRLPPERRGRLVSISTDHERTLFFDFLPVDLGQVNGFLTRFHLYTVPGQAYYKLSRRAVLQGLDGLVMVADSHPAREQANRDSLADTRTHLATLGMDDHQVSRIPWIFQYNKRDVVAALPLERMRNLLNPGGAPEFEAVAREGRGVSETLRAACKAVLSRLTGDMLAARPTGAQAGMSIGAAAGAVVATPGNPGIGNPGIGTPVAGAPGATAPATPAAGAPPLPRPNMPQPRIATAPRRIATPSPRA